MFVKDLITKLSKEDLKSKVHIYYDNKYNVPLTKLVGIPMDESGISFYILLSNKKDKIVPITTKELIGDLRKQDPYAVVQMSYDGGKKISVTKFKRKSKDELGNSFIIMLSEKDEEDE